MVMNKSEKVTFKYNSSWIFLSIKYLTYKQLLNYKKLFGQLKHPNLYCFLILFTLFLQILLFPFLPPLSPSLSPQKKKKKKKKKKSKMMTKANFLKFHRWCHTLINKVFKTVCISVTFPELWTGYDNCHRSLFIHLFHNPFHQPTVRLVAKYWPFFCLPLCPSLKIFSTAFYIIERLALFYGNLCFVFFFFLQLIYVNFQVIKIECWVEKNEHF